jgi:hypothetical protein
MPVREVLILAMSRMRSGICTAGMTTERDAVTSLRWVRPVREFDTLLPGDLADPNGNLLQCSDVIEMNLVSPRPDPPHVEDWVTDFIRCRPRLARRLEGERRADFFARHLDRAPEDVLVHQTRSLCLVKPEYVSASFSLDAYSGKYEARMSVALPHDLARTNVSVTDLKWRALGRTWLENGGQLTLEHSALVERLRADSIYLALGLSRNYQGQFWPLVVGVHVVPDYDAAIDLDHL